MFFLQNQHLFVVITIVEIQDAEILFFHDRLEHLLTEMRECFLFHLKMNLGKFIEHGKKSLFSYRKTVHPSKSLINKAKSLIIENLKASNNG